MTIAPEVPAASDPAAHEALARAHLNALDAVGARRHGQMAVEGFDGAAQILILYLYVTDYLGAIAFGQTWLATHPDDVDALVYVSRALYMLGRYDEALELLTRASRLAPERPDVIFGHAETLMLVGEVATAWARFEALANETILQGVDARIRPDLSSLWRGQSLAGKRILVVNLLGIGDNLMMARYAQSLKARGAQVTFCCRPELLRLLAKLEGVDDLIADWRVRPWADFDHWTFDFLLPVHLGGPQQDIPAFEKGYVARPRAAAPRTPASPGRRRVGLCWSSGPDHFTGLARFLTPEDLRPLAALTGIDWFVVQKGPATADFAARSGLAAQDFSPEWADFHDLAAFMGEMDLIISICSGPLHLAGALGLPTWGLICAAPDWRWGTGGESTAWYPNMRLFRQSRLHDWAQVVSQVKSALESYVEATSPGAK